MDEALHTQQQTPERAPEALEAQLGVIVDKIEDYYVPSYKEIVVDYRGALTDIIDTKEAGLKVDEDLEGSIATFAEPSHWLASKAHYAGVLKTNNPSELTQSAKREYRDYKAKMTEQGKKYSFRGFQTYAYKRVKLAEEIERKEALETAIEPAAEAPRAVQPAADEPRRGRSTHARAAKPQPANDVPSPKAPEGDKSRRKVSNRTLASIGGLAALHEVASLRNSKGVDHFYGFDDKGKMRHISRDDALEWYDNYDTEVPAAPKEVSAALDIKEDALAWLGVSAAEFVALVHEEEEKRRQALAKDTARREAEQKRTAGAAATVAPTQASAPESAAGTMVSPPRRPSLWQRLKDTPNRWAVRSMEWARRHKAETILGGVAVATVVYGAAYALTRDHSAAHNALEGLQPSGGGGNGASEASRHAISSGAAPHSATNKDLIDSLSGQSGATDANADHTTNKSLIDSLSGQDGSKPDASTNKSLIDSLSGDGGSNVSPEVSQNVELSLTHSGDTIWGEVKDYLGQHNLPTDNWSVDFVKDRVLKSNGLTEKLATTMHVGSTFTIPRAVLEELVKAKKS